MLTRDAILKADDLKSEHVEVPEWGGTVKVKQMTAGERDHFESALIVGGKVNQENIRAKLCALCMVGADGKRLFSEADIPALSAKSAQAMNRVFEVAQRINGMSGEAVEQAKKSSAPDTPAVSLIA